MSVDVAGERLELFCKYGRPVTYQQAHRRGVCYEAEIYDKILSPAGLLGTFFYGLLAFEECSALVVDAVQDAQPCSKAGSSCIVAAASWLGSFHRKMSEPARTAHAFLTQYDSSHFEYWFERAEARAAQSGLAPSWMPILRERYFFQVQKLLQEPSTLIHGELYPANMLATDDGLHPIDWESAGLGCAEIDLGCLLMGWSDGVIRECIHAYSASRGIDAGTRAFADRMATVRVYLELRDFKSRPGRVDFFDYLHGVARSVGFLPESSEEVSVGG